MFHCFPPCGPFIRPVTSLLICASEPLSFSFSSIVCLFLLVLLDRILGKGFCKKCIAKERKHPLSQKYKEICIDCEEI